MKSDVAVSDYELEYSPYEYFQSPIERGDHFCHFDDKHLKTAQHGLSILYTHRTSLNVV